jgi:exoribonuclease II
VLTHSWTARFPLKLDNGFQILEYACAEDNHVIPDWISVTRAEQQKAAAAAAKEQH